MLFVPLLASSKTLKNHGDKKRQLNSIYFRFLRNLADDAYGGFFNGS
jgi:hypothetical protein